MLIVPRRGIVRLTTVDARTRRARECPRMPSTETNACIRSKSSDRAPICVIATVFLPLCTTAYDVFQRAGLRRNDKCVANLYAALVRTPRALAIARFANRRLLRGRGGVVAFHTLHDSCRATDAFGPRALGRDSRGILASGQSANRRRVPLMRDSRSNRRRAWASISVHRAGMGKIWRRSNLLRNANHPSRRSFGRATRTEVFWRRSVSGRDAARRSGSARRSVLVGCTSHTSHSVPASSQKMEYDK